jgi:hypothetical protein
MKRRTRVTELMQREGLRGEVVELFYSRSTGMIHGEDGYDVTFNEESLVVGLSYRELGLGVKVPYRLFLRPEQSFPPRLMSSLRLADERNRARLRKAYFRQAQVPFRKSALSGAEFHTLSSGQRVCYRVHDGWLGKEAVEVRPLPIDGIARHG